MKWNCREKNPVGSVGELGAKNASAHFILGLLGSERIFALFLHVS